MTTKTITITTIEVDGAYMVGDDAAMVGGVDVWGSDGDAESLLGAASQVASRQHFYRNQGAAISTHAPIDMVFALASIGELS